MIFFLILGKKLLDKEVDRSSKYIHVLGEVNKRTKETEVVNYRVEMRRIRLGEAFSDDLDKLSEEEIRKFQDENTMVAMYFFDETRVSQIKAEIDNQKLVAGLIYIDNYEEVLESADEVKHSLLLTLVDRRITNCLAAWMRSLKRLKKINTFSFFSKSICKS